LPSSSLTCNTGLPRQVVVGFNSLLRMSRFGGWQTCLLHCKRHILSLPPNRWCIRHMHTCQIAWLLLSWHHKSSCHITLIAVCDRQEHLRHLYHTFPEHKLMAGSISKMFKIWICGQVFVCKKHLSTFMCISK
jgi:hypothetical protein